MVFGYHLPLEFSSCFYPESPHEYVSLEFSARGNVEIVSADYTPHGASKIDQTAFHFGDDSGPFSNIKHGAGKSTPEFSFDARKTLRFDLSPQGSTVGNEKVQHETVQDFFQ